MRLLFEEYADALYEVLVCVIVVVFIILGTTKEILNINANYLENQTEGIVLNNEYIGVGIKEFSVKDQLIFVKKKFNATKEVSAKNTRGEDIRAYVSVLENVDTSKAGEYELTYVLRYNGQFQAIKAKLIIVDEKKEVISNQDNV